MPYIGRGPQQSGAFRIIDDISGDFNGVLTSFALEVGSAALTVGLPETLLIAVDGVIQEAGSAYTISGSNIVFAAPPLAEATFCGVELGDVGGIADNIVDGKITTDKIVNDAVTADKLANSINTEIAANTAKTGITTSQANAITANTAKVTNATHTGDVTGATSLTLAAGAVDIAHLSASGTKDGTTVLHGNNTFAAVSGIPSGAIIMWHGLIANIPGGWVLCNGSNSTPDLRGQFVQGAANGVEAGATGGSATATPAAHSNHSVTQPSTHAALASHSHATNHGTWSTYRHGFARGGAGYGTSTSFTITARSLYNYQSVSTGAGGMLTESIAAGTPNAHSGTAVDAHSAHSTSDSRPPFYTILYIMKS